MRRDRENLRERLHDAVTGYAVVVLSIVCFLLVLGAATAAIRILWGAG